MGGVGRPDSRTGQGLGPLHGCPGHPMQTSNLLAAVLVLSALGVAWGLKP